ncbi:MAG: succinate--CoA ligase subunit alpha [Methanomassiliicoccales archaeon]|nr:MAG: succinate--CoA ligase subunit alpha [Methanomassiliicoccales archaeon]
MRLGPRTKVLVQGITGHQGSIHTDLMLRFGTNIVGGVTPGKSGEKVSGLPVFNTVSDAISKTGAECSVIFVPARNCMDAAIEAMDAGIRMLVVVTEHVPVHDTMKIKRIAERTDSIVIGPNSPGIVVPSAIKLGIIPNDIFLHGDVAVLSRSGTLTYEVVMSLTEHGIGQCFVAGVGGDRIIGTSMARLAILVNEQYGPKGYVIIGEIGGREEVEAAKAISDIGSISIAYIAGKTAPEGKRMGHAGALIGDISDTYIDKTNALKDVGSIVCDRLSLVPIVVRDALY